MPSEIILEFSAIPVVDERIDFNLTDPSLGQVYSIYKTQRIVKHEVSIVPGGLFACINNLSIAFDVDFNTFNDFLIENDFPNLRIKITHLNQQGYFDNAAVSGGTAISIVSVVNTPADIDPEITDLEFVDVNCTDLTTTVTLNQLYPIIRYEDSLGGNSGFILNPPNPYVFTSQRGLDYNFFVHTSDPATLQNRFTFSFSSPKLWNISGITQTITPNGYLITVNIEETGNGASSYTYSLDGVNFNPSNSFSNVVPGNYIVYVRDKEGCNKSLAVTVLDDPFLLPDEPLMTIPISNSFHWIEDQLVDGCEVYQNELNTLSGYESTVNSRRFYHLVQKCDCIQSQFRSNFDSHTATLYGCDGTEQNILIEKKTENLNQFDFRDYTIFPVDGFLAFFSFGGNLYDAQGNVTGSNPLFSEVLQYHEQGTVVFIDYNNIGYQRISEVRYFESFDAWVAITEFPYTDPAVPNVKITTNYNIRDYDNYEFEIDFANLEGTYFLRLQGTKGAETKDFVTEFINVQEKHENTHEIISRHRTNKEVNYSTGIYFKMRLPYVVPSTYTPTDENESYRKDTNVISLDSETRDQRTFTFSPMPTGIAVKLNELLSNDTIYIDRREYVREQTPEIENLGGGSNLYSFNVNLSLGTDNLIGLTKDELLLKILRFSNATQSYLEEIQGSGFLALDNEGTGFLALDNSLSSFLKLSI